MAEKTKDIQAKIRSIGDVRENKSGKGFNLFLRTYEMKKGVYIFSDKKESLDAMKAKLKPDMTVKLLGFSEDEKGSKAKSVEPFILPPQQEKGQAKITDTPNEKPKSNFNGMVKMLRIGSNRYEGLNQESLKKYEDDYILYAAELYRKIQHTVNPTNTTGIQMVDLIFDKMCTPFIYYIEEDLMRKGAIKAFEKTKRGEADGRQTGY
jgi:hypothetical protein